MKVSDEDLEMLRKYAVARNGVPITLNVIAELMALRKVARAAWLMRAFERYTGRCVVHDDSYDELKSALEEAGYHA